MNSLVHSRSIQSTLQALSRETDAFRQQASETDRERGRLQQRLQQLKAKQREISVQIHAARDYLGSYHRENALLCKEESRLKGQFQQERVDFEKACQEHAAIEQDEIKSKQQYSKEMMICTDELTNLLKRFEDEGLLKLISAEAVKELVLQQQAEMQNAASPQHKAMTEINKAMTSLESSSEMHNVLCCNQEELDAQLTMLRSSSKVSIY
jgi:chromosome segregation ATPase